jgi:hypothetical protein
MNKKFLSLTAFGLAGFSTLLMADPIPYPNSGTQNPVTYTFTATATGDLDGFFAAQTGASFSESVGLLDNGVLTSAGYGLDNHSSATGQEFDFGHVTAGDTLVFVLNVYGNTPNPGFAYSDPSMNGLYDTGSASGVGLNHIYSVAYNSTSGDLDPSVPSGTYVAFEDLPGFVPPDWNYGDDTFVFTDVSTVDNSVPDGGMTISMLGMALTGLGLLRRKA